MNTITNLIPYAVLVAQALLVLAFLSVIFRDSGLGYCFQKIARHAAFWGFLVALVAILGSLFYSNVVGYEACSLCWWQRVLIYPQALIFLIALIKKDDSPFLYAVPLATIAGIIALYQVYINLGGASLLPCTVAGSACAKVYVKAFGFITIPVMSLTISLYIIVLGWANRVFRKLEW